MLREEFVFALALALVSPDALSDLLRTNVDDPSLHLFRDKYLPNLEAARLVRYRDWRRQNPGEAAKWDSFRDAVLRGEQVAVPMLASPFGKMLVAAGEMHMSISRLIGTVVPVLPPSVVQPIPIAGLGYTKVFDENFNTFDTNVWRRGIWYQPEATSSEVFVQDGILHILSQRISGNTFTDVNVSTHVGQNDPRTKAFKRGYFEARIWAPAGMGHHMAWWMMSENWMNTGNCSVLLNSELDIMETSDGDPFKNIGTLHSNTSGNCATPDQNNAAGNASLTVSTNQFGGFHVYSALWTASEIKWYLNDVLIRTFPTYASTDQLMSLMLSSYTNSWGPNPDATTPNVLDVQVDWVRVWQII